MLEQQLHVMWDRDRERRGSHASWLSSRVVRERLRQRAVLQEEYFATLMVDSELEEVAV